MRKTMEGNNKIKKNIKIKSDKVIYTNINDCYLLFVDNFIIVIIIVVYNLLYFTL